MTSDPKTKNDNARIPQATYRLQFHEHFQLRDALKLVPYLYDLGVSHVYASPLLKARKHSPHGYDVCDFNQLNPELGTEADLAELVSALRERGMGLVLDIVPNHMSIGGMENRWWWDVLARGPASPFAKYFDIDWNAPDPRLRGKILVPILADRYHQVLQKHELQLVTQFGNLFLCYGQNSFPINRQSLKTIQVGVAELNSDPQALDALVDQQFYRLTSARHSDSELNYRRFFNISSMAGLCVEKEEVFDEVHALVQQWLQRGWLDGLRVDHPDGLRDPVQFLHRLEKMAPGAWIIIEKILERNETLPVSWPVAGTTGYDFLNHATGLFIDPSGEKPLTDFYSEFTGVRENYTELERHKKQSALRTLLIAEVDRLTGLLVHIAARHWRYRDFTRAELSEALIEMTASFPVYRTYVRPAEKRVTEADASHIASAANEAIASRPDLAPELFEFLTELLLLTLRGEMEGEFVVRFQQLSAPAMAKGAEDTAYYCYNRFVALNEVGGDPGHFGCSVDEFHQFCRHQQTHWPSSMLATSTHDTKRSEDVRARLALLTEIPESWQSVVRRWSAINKRHRRNGLPDSNTEYLFYQTLVGAWPLSAQRAVDYMEKAVREAREFTAWTNGNAVYDAALRDFVMGAIEDPDFRDALESFVTPMIKPGCMNSLAQTLLKLTAPGVPDIYQGTELWEFDLVDPDNRRPVDFAPRQQLLAKLKTFSAEEVWKNWESGLPKLWLIRQVLKLRRQRPELFSPSAGYEALQARGEKSAHVVAFLRGGNLIAVVPRLVIGIHGDWRNTTLNIPAGNWRNELTGEKLPCTPAPLAGLLNKFPVALLTRVKVAR